LDEEVNLQKNQLSYKKRKKAACFTTKNNEQQISECAVNVRSSQESEHININISLPQISQIIINKERKKLM